METILESRYFWMSMSLILMMSVAVWSISGARGEDKEKTINKNCK